MYTYLDIETVPFEIVHDDIKTYLMDKKIGKEIRSFDPNYCKIIVIAEAVPQLFFNSDSLKYQSGKKIY